MSAGQRNSGCVFNTASWLTPESIQTSSVSFRLVNPDGNPNLSAIASSLSAYQTLVPCSRTNSATLRIQFGSSTGSVPPTNPRRVHPPLRGRKKHRAGHDPTVESIGSPPHPACHWTLPPAATPSFLIF